MVIVGWWLRAVGGGYELLVVITSFWWWLRAVGGGQVVDAQIILGQGTTRERP